MMTLSRRRLLMLFAFLTAWASVVVARLVLIQLVRHQEYVVRAVKQHELTLELTPVRGSILDAHGRTLAESVTAESIYADPQAVNDPKATAIALASIAGVDVSAADIEKRLRGRSEFTWISRQLPVDVSDRVRALKLAGIYILEEHRRSYPKGTLAASVLGYVSVDGEGLAGIEHSFDSYVRGRNGKVTLLRDARRGMYMMGGEGPNAPVEGENVILTIDEVIQYLAEEALSRAVTKWGAIGGTAIVMDPNDGSILAMANLPGFDPNHLRDSSPVTWRNKAMQDLYEPGSTFKIVTASAGLEQGLVTPSQIIDCGPGYIEIAGVRIKEHGGNAYGLMPFEDVMVHSSNVGMIRVALALGQKNFYRYMRQFGFGEQTGISLPGEAVGIVRPPQKWSELSNASMAIGQEIAVTPLQILRAACTVANGGRRIDPRIVDRVVDGSGRTIYRPEPAPPTRIISERTAAVLNEILKQVVVRGTGRNAALDEHVVAGKTGTAQKAARGGYAADKYVASFVGYVPADRPRLAILVVVDEPKGTHYGGTVAAPAFREIAEGALRYLRVPPSVPGRVINLDGIQLAALPERPLAPQAAMAHRSPGQTAIAPDLVGLDARRAVAVAAASGFEVRATGGGVVIRQSVAPGLASPERQIGIVLDESGASR